MRPEREGAAPSSGMATSRSSFSRTATRRTSGRSPMPSCKSSRPGKAASAPPRFPRTAKYHPDWITSCVSGGANSLWLTEWLCESLDLAPGMRVLDLGCGRAASSIFLHREFGVQVWAADLWVSATENQKRITDAGAGMVYPIHADARSLPFAGEFFDAIVCIDSYPYFGTDELYLNYLAHFVKPGGQIGIAGAGLVKEFEGGVPQHLKAFWTQDCWCLHSAKWWSEHWGKTGIVSIETAETMPGG